LGCADGTREAFADISMFPNIAACAGEWDGQKDLRSPKSGTPCGNTLGQLCNEPADLCSNGWRVCVSTGNFNDILQESPLEIL
jgi:hypothetical protein